MQCSWITAQQDVPIYVQVVVMMGVVGYSGLQTIQCDALTKQTQLHAYTHVKAGAKIEAQTRLGEEMGGGGGEGSGCQ